MSPNLSPIISDISFWICLGSVFLFAYGRFNVSLIDTDELAPPLRPHAFTLAFRFQLVAFIYVGVHALVYFALIYCGSIPDLQAPIAKLFGGLTDANGKQLGVGTPAWAALIASAAAPSIPWLVRLDERVRSKLHDLASIPRKAELIGAAVLKAPGFPQAPVVPSDPSRDQVMAAAVMHRRRFARLRTLWDELQQSGDQKVKGRYGTFFHDNKTVLDGFTAEFAVDPSDLPSTDAAAFEDRLAASVRKAARLTGCALLNAEASEAAIGRRLALHGIVTPPLGLEFRFVHLIVAFFALGLMAIAGSYTAVGVYAAASGQAGLDIIVVQWRNFLMWGGVNDAAYLLPVLLAAGVAMYLVDRRLSEDPLDMTARLAIGIVTFVGAAGLALFVLLGWSFLLLKATGSSSLLTNEDHVVVGRIVPWILPPAIVATTFLALSGRRALPRVWLDILFDAAACGAAAAGAAALSLLFTTKVQGYHYDPLKLEVLWYLAPITAGMVGVTVGMILCLTVRRPCAALAAQQAAASPGAASGLVAAAGAAGAIAAAIVPAAPLIAPHDVAVMAPGPAVAGVAAPDDDASG
jgi:hypothetical protein